MKPTTLDYLIAFLFSSRSTKIYRKILWERTYSKQKKLNVNSFNQHLYRLRKKGIIRSNERWIYIEKKNLVQFVNMNNFVIKDIFPNKSEKILISFDIPEKKKKVRDWLRNQIKYWDFEMIQKSLWLGYGPMPREFNDRLKQLGIYQNVRIFKIKKTS
jgi:DNA-binding transcriptional regulator PaaX